MSGQRPGADQGNSVLFTLEVTHKEHTQGMHVGQRGYRHEECSIGINGFPEDRSEVRCSDSSSVLTL